MAKIAVFIGGIRWRGWLGGGEELYAFHSHGKAFNLPELRRRPSTWYLDDDDDKSVGRSGPSSIQSNDVDVHLLIAAMNNVEVKVKDGDWICIALHTMRVGD
jgi:hypothetical protein